MNRSQFRTMLEIKKAMKAATISPSRAMAEIANFRLDKGDSVEEAEATARGNWNQWMMEMRGL